MASKKPKNATAGKRIAKWTHSWAGFWFKTNTFDAKLSGRIDRAIARAVRNGRDRERGRCGLLVLAFMGGRIAMDELLEMVRDGSRA